MVCSGCKCEIAPGLKFCEKCGKPVGSDAGRYVSSCSRGLKQLFGSPLFIVTLSSVIVLLMLTVAKWYLGSSSALLGNESVTKNIGMSLDLVRLIAMLISVIPVLFIAIGTVVLFLFSKGKSRMSGCGFIIAGAIIKLIYICFISAGALWLCYSLFDGFSELDNVKIISLAVVGVIAGILISYYAAFIRTARTVHIALIGANTYRKPSAFLAVINIVNVLINFLGVIAYMFLPLKISSDELAFELVFAITDSIVLMLFTVLIFKARDIFSDESLTVVREDYLFSDDNEPYEDEVFEYEEADGESRHEYDDTYHYDVCDGEEDILERTVSIEGDLKYSLCKDCGKMLRDGEVCSCTEKRIPFNSFGDAAVKKEPEMNPPVNHGEKSFIKGDMAGGKSDTGYFSTVKKKPEPYSGKGSGTLKITLPESREKTEREIYDNRIGKKYFTRGEDLDI